MGRSVGRFLSRGVRELLEQFGELRAARLLGEFGARWCSHGATLRRSCARRAARKSRRPRQPRGFFFMRSKEEQAAAESRRFFFMIP